MYLYYWFSSPSYYSFSYFIAFLFGFLQFNCSIACCCNDEMIHFTNVCETKDWFWERYGYFSKVWKYELFESCDFIWTGVLEYTVTRAAMMSHANFNRYHQFSLKGIWNQITIRKDSAKLNIQIALTLWILLGNTKITIYQILQI